jgi:methylated-DNA-[protein]-cysteine S-methyltransferase
VEIDKMKSDFAVVETPVGRIKLVEAEEGGRRVLAEVVLYCEEKLIPPSTKLLKEVVKQLDRYLAGEMTTFAIPLSNRESASSFRHSVWDRMVKIPYGAVATYGDIAKELLTYAQAVGGACKANPLPIVVPCHRVISSNGLGGYSGEWEGKKANSVKKTLLKLEGAL